MSADSHQFDLIASKLKRLNCSLLGNGEDWWIKDLLFKPGLHRYQLLEWALVKLNVDIKKESEVEPIEEARINTLATTLSTLRVCKKNDRDVIKGNTGVSRQLNFWKIIIDKVYEHEKQPKSSSSSLRNANLTASQESIDDTVTKDYEKSCTYVKELCNRVNFKHLFNEKNIVLPPDIEIECQQSIPPDQEIENDETIIGKKELIRKCKEQLAIEDSSSLMSDVEQQSLSLKEYEGSVKFDEHESNINERLQISFVKLQQVALGDFANFHRKLKPTMFVDHDQLSNSAAELKTATEAMKIFVNLQASLHQFKLSQAGMEELEREISESKSLPLKLTSQMLADFIPVLKCSPVDICEKI